MKQKKRNRATRYLLAMFLLFTIAFAACGGGGGGDDGGGGGGGGGPTPLTTGTFTKIFGPTDDGNNSYPFHGTFDQKVQLLYTAAEINGSGNIIALRFRRSNVSAQETCPNTTIRLGHTSLTTLTATFGSNVEEGRGSQVTVLNDTTVTIPAGAAGTWFEIPLGTAFNYNGVDNLVVEVERTTACSASVSTDVSNAANRRAQSSATDITPGVAEHNQTTANTVDTAQNWMQFTFAGGDDKTLYPVSTGNAVPFWTTVVSQHAQMLHLVSDINGSGPITGIAIISTEAPTDVATYTVNIKLGHTTLAALTNNFANNFNSGSPASVATAATFTVPAGVPAGTPIWLPLNGVFTYNGTDNLIVDIEVTSAATITDWAYDGTIAGRRMYAAVGSATGTVAAGAYHTVFRFNGGTMDVNPAITSSDSQPFSTTANRGQYLYRAAELGTGGQITKVSCRLSSSASSATDYANFVVTLGHAAAPTLSTTAANNMVNATEVFNGTFSLPAGLIQGDWVEIPLTTPFNYNAEQDLVVQIQTNGGSTTHSCMASPDATLYASRHGYAWDPVGATQTVNNYTRHIRLWIQK